MIKINGKKNYKNLSATAKITGKKIKKITKFSLKKKGDKPHRNAFPCSETKASRGYQMDSRL